MIHEKEGPNVKAVAFALALAAAGVAGAENVVNITGVGATKFAVEIAVGHPMFRECLKRNLELSGLFQVGGSGAIRVSGAPGAIRAEGRGKVVNCPIPFADDKAARMAARRLSDAMCEAFGQQKGFALDKVLFLLQPYVRRRHSWSWRESSRRCCRP